MAAAARPACDLPFVLVLLLLLVLVFVLVLVLEKIKRIEYEDEDDYEARGGAGPVPPACKLGFQPNQRKKESVLPASAGQK